MKKLLFPMMLTGLSIFCASAMLFVACDSPDQLGPDKGGGGGGIGGGPVIIADAAPPSNRGGSGGGGNTGEPPTGDAHCGSITSSTSRMPADVLLVLDRSGSMDYSTTSDENCARDPDCTPRWPALSSAVSATLATTAGSINWGLKLYSTPNGGSSCAVSAGVEVQVSASSVSEIQSVIENVSPGQNTPTAQAIEAATAYLKTLTTPNNKVILLATDGEPNCRPGASGSSTNVPGTVTAIGNARAAGFPVYVIGIGPSVGNLDNFAEAGGTGKYYPASSPEELTNAFASISQTVATCSFVSPSPPPDPANVAVYLDKQLVQKDAANGWSFGATQQTIILNGSTCERVKSGDATTVEILFGCPGAPPQTIP